MNGNSFRYITKDLLDSIWPPIDNSFKKVENPIPLNNPIIDKLLYNYSIGDNKKTAIFSKIVERMSLPRVAEPATIDTRDSHNSRKALHTAHMGTTPSGGL